VRVVRQGAKEEVVDEVGGAGEEENEEERSEEGPWISNEEAGV
jgi:hypothetical protein